jgi:DNA-binding transcriptional MerR regulator
MHKDGYYSSGEFAKKSNVSVRTIRYYDQQNILKPSLLTDEGVRFYTDSDFTRDVLVKYTTLVDTTRREILISLSLSARSLANLNHLSFM